MMDTGSGKSSADPVEAEMARMRAEVMANPRYHGLGENFQRFLDERGIVPERITPDSYSCCIGFSESEQKWYGWSHRGVCGFGVGSEVSKGDCAYHAPNPNDFLEDMRRFFDDEQYNDRTWAYHGDKNGELGVWIVQHLNQEVPNPKMRGRELRSFYAYPKKFGRGEWKAETLEDAKQMAIDYFEGVA